MKKHDVTQAEADTAYGLLAEGLKSQKDTRMAVDCAQAPWTYLRESWRPQPRRSSRGSHQLAFERISHTGRINRMMKN